MKSMQRMGGKMMKRSADQQDVGQVIAQFKATDEMLIQLIKDLKAWRDGWDEILKLQYNASEAFAELYKPIEPTNNPDQTHTPTVTPRETMQKCLALQKMYSETKDDLQQEIGMIDTKILKPVEEAKGWMKTLHKTLKHRENMKLDYERYLSRAEHSRKKEIKSAKEEAVLAKNEGDLAQSEINYQTADDQVKQTFPPVVEAVLSLLPYLLANQVMIQTTLVGQIYTSLDGYCRQQQFPSPAPSDGEIISIWDSQFTGFRREVEQGLRTLANGKAVHQNMTIPEKNGTVTGLGIRNKTTSFVTRSKGNQNLPKPVGIGRTDSAGPGASPRPSYREEEEEEVAPPKPPRPGTMGPSSPAVSPMPGMPMSSKPRMPSYSSNTTAPYDQKATNFMPSYPSEKPPPPYSASAASTPTSHYLTPTNSLSPNPTSTGNDYFASSADARRASSHSLASSAASIAAAKKKPPPPVPAKRLPSQQGHFVTALYDFEGQNPGDLTFREGDRIRVVRKTDSTDDWWAGELRGKTGEFPANYVQL